MIRSRAICGALALATLAPGAAFAQTVRNPFADLFGRAPDRSGKEFTAVQFRSSAGVQFGQTLQADFEQPDVVPSGLAGGADASISADFIRDRVQLIGEGRYSYQEFRQSPAFGAPGFDGGGRINFQATTRLAFEAGGRFVRSPFFSLLWNTPEMFGPSRPGPAVGSQLLLMKNDTIEGNAGLVGQLGRRSTFTAGVFTRETNFALSPQYDFASRGARGLYRRQLNRLFAFRAGYSREELLQNDTGIDERYVNEVLDLGVDFAKAFSMGRRSMWSFATETSMVRENGGPRHYRLNGHVGFERRFLRTWITQLSAVRATEFLPGFKAPVFTERGEIAMAGYLASRLLFNVNGEAGQGHVGVNDAKQFITYTGDTSLTFGLTRHFGVFAQYAYYHYQMPPDPIAVAAAPRLSRQAVSIGVRTWVSIIDKDKVPRDPR